MSQAFIFQESIFLTVYVEGLFYGKISDLCALNSSCTLAKEVQLFSGLGLYTGIFAIYLRCASKSSRAANVVLYTLWLLYVLSTVSFVCDIITSMFQVSNNSIICKNIIF